MVIVRLAGVLGIAALSTGAAEAAAPPGFAPCSVCHSVEPGKTGIGPNLRGVVGRKAGSLPGYAYSTAMKTSGIVWTRDRLDAYLTKPQAVVKGTKMIYAGIADAKAREAVIAYLASMK